MSGRRALIADGHHRYVVDQTIVATALPAIAADTGNVARASWIVVSYLIASTIAAPIYGRLGDAFGAAG